MLGSKECSGLLNEVCDVLIVLLRRLETGLVADYDGEIVGHRNCGFSSWHPTENYGRKLSI